MKSLPKTNISFNFYHLPSSTVLEKKANTTIQVLKHFTLFLLLLISNFLFFDSRVFIFIVFCISSNKLNRILFGICLFIIQKQAFRVRHRFEDSWNMNVLNWKLYRKINSMRTWSSWKVEYLNEITLFLPLKFEYANYLFPIQRFLCIFYDPAEYWI